MSKVTSGTGVTTLQLTKQLKILMQTDVNDTKTLCRQTKDLTAVMTITHYYQNHYYLFIFSMKLPRLKYKYISNVKAHYLRKHAP